MRQLVAQVCTCYQVKHNTIKGCFIGGGPGYQFKKQIHKKIFEDVIGVNNTAVAHGGIDV